MNTTRLLSSRLYDWAVSFLSHVLHSTSHLHAQAQLPLSPIPCIQLLLALGHPFGLSSVPSTFTALSLNPITNHFSKKTPKKLKGGIQKENWKKKMGDSFSETDLSHSQKRTHAKGEWVSRGGIKAGTNSTTWGLPTYIKKRRRSGDNFWRAWSQGDPSLSLNTKLWQIKKRDS